MAIHPYSLLQQLLRPVRKLVAVERTEDRDRRLALTLTFVAGAVNAGGLLAIGQYTSHMSGIISAMADHLAVGAWLLVGGGVVALGSFMGGAAISAVLINWARRHRRRAQYSLPMLLEAALLALFGTLGALLPGTLGFTAAAVPLLCFIMGLQNATITKVSGARMRTTHMTGIVTDIGIELGKLFYWNRHQGGSGPHPHVRADRAKLRLLASLLGCFFGGGVLGAWGFALLGFAAALPLAVLLAAIGAAPIMEVAVVLQGRRNGPRRGPIQAPRP
ncbi:YoaK family protein [Rhodovarius lipocyclicus]|uniref:YoaK family protein n=1 Tax=Rhodovarius lipocyclicus TaxID=268410 RepID=UPI001356AB11|nr:YoaK family protein [Rhodovarius lipocyclicus]